MNKKFELTEILQVIGLAVTIATAVGGYLLVQRVQQSVDAEKLEVDHTKLLIESAKNIKELKPALDVECSASQISGNLIRLEIKEKNVGSQSVSATPPSISLAYETGSMVNNNEFDVRDDDGNEIPSGTEGNPAYFIKSKNKIDWRRISVKSSFDVSSDPTMIEALKEILKNEIQPQVIDQLSHGNYRCTTGIETISPPSRSHRHS